MRPNSLYFCLISYLLWWWALPPKVQSRDARTRGLLFEVVTCVLFISNVGGMNATSSVELRFYSEKGTGPPTSSIYSAEGEKIRLTND